MHSVILAMLIASGLGGPGRPEPFPHVPGDEVVVGADGAIVYDWPPAPTLSLLTTPLGEIDAWMERASWRAAKIHKWARHDLAGECPERDRWCMCINGRVGPYPVDRMLSFEQWRVLVERVRRDAERTADLTHVRSLLDRLVMFRGSLETAQTPDLTPLLLAVIDGAARGDRTFLLHASKVHEWSDANPGILNRQLVQDRLHEAMERVTTQEQAFAVAVLASSLGLGNNDQETLMLERIRANEFRATAVRASQPLGPWEPGQGGRIVTDSQGRKCYVWPPVPDAYLETAPLGEIAEWIEEARTDEAVATGRASRRTPGEVVMIEKRMTICFVSPASFNVKPLTLSQWNALAHRSARSLRMGGPDTAEPAVRLAGLMDGFPLETDWPSDGFRVLAEELLGHCLNADSESFHTVVRLTASFTHRSGHTGLLRRAADRMRHAPDTGSRVRLAEIAAACVPAEHDLNPVEATIFGAELLSAADCAPSGAQQFTITSAALSVGWAGTSALWAKAVASDHPDMRRAAMRWASEQVRAARWNSDARRERALRAGIDRIVAAMDDSDEQVAASAIDAVITMLKDEPDALAAILMSGLGTRSPRLDTMACYALASVPGHAAPALNTLRRLSATSDESLRMAAAEAVAAIEGARSSTGAATGP